MGFIVLGERPRGTSEASGRDSAAQPRVTLLGLISRLTDRL